jgi:hypothetical protein
MPEKQKTRNLKDPQTIMAAVAMSLLLMMWNMFATHDRRRVGDIPSILSTPTVTTSKVPENVCPTSTPIKNLGKKCVSVTVTRSS